MENNKLVAPFILEFIDGDGVIQERSIKIVSKSDKFLEDVKKVLGNINISSGKIRQDRTRYIVNISGKENLKKLYDKMYDDSMYFYPRKRKRYRQMFIPEVA